MTDSKSACATRRTFLLAGAAALFGGAAHGQQASSRPIRLLVGFGAGGAGDVVARLYALKMQEVLGTPVIVENKPGALSLMAIQPLLSAAPDGYTLMLGTGSSLVQGPAVTKDLSYSPLRDFSYIGMLTASAGIFSVNPALPVRTMGELIAYAKANPGKLNYGSSGVGSIAHLLPEYVTAVSGISATHIPFKSDLEVVRELAAGTLHFSVNTVSFVLPLARDGRIRPVAVAGPRRLRELPEVASLTEERQPELRGIDNYTYYSLVGPPGMSVQVIERLNDAANRVSALPDIAMRLQGLNMDPVIGTPAAFRDFVEKELVKWREIVKKIGFEPGK